MELDIECRCQDVNSTVHVLPTSEEGDSTSSEVGEVGDNNVRLRTPIPNETRTYDGNQTHENSSLETTSKENYVHIGKTALIKSENGNTISNPDPHEAYRKREGKQSSTVPDREEESPVLDIRKLEEKNNLSPRDLKLLRLKDTEVKQNEEKYEELFRLKDEELRNLRTEKKQNEDKFKVTIERFEKQIRNLQTKSDEEIRDVYEAWDKVYVSDSKKIRELKDEIEILEKDIGDVYEASDKVCVSDSKKIRELEDEIEILEKGVKKTKEMEDENARLKDENARLEDDKARLEEEKKCKVCLSEEKKYIVLPCCHYGVCENCFNHEEFNNEKCPYCRTQAKDILKVFNL